jgi:hypothetical protein
MGRSEDRSNKAENAFIRIGRAGCKERNCFVERKGIGEKKLLFQRIILRSLWSFRGCGWRGNHREKFFKL